MAWLIANERVRDYGCNSVRAAAEYFNKACAPGARSPYFQNRSVGCTLYRLVHQVEDKFIKMEIWKDAVID